MKKKTRKNRYSLFLKLFAGYFFITVLLAALIFLFTFEALKKNYIETVTAQLKNTAAAVSFAVTPLYIENKLDELDALVKQIGAPISARITVINPRGAVAADSREDPRLMENHIERPEVRGAMAGKTGIGFHFSKTTRENMFYVASPVYRNGALLYVLRVSVFSKNIAALLDAMRLKMIVAVLIILIISLIAAYMVSKKLSDPVRDLCAAAQEIALGNFDVKICAKNNDELQDLTDSFNHMIDRIRGLFAELSGQKEELDAVISSIYEAIIVLDEEEKIILCNKTAREILNAGAPEGKPIGEFMSGGVFDEILLKTRRLGGSACGEISVNGKIFRCGAARVSPTKISKTVIILYDITQIKNMEQMKKDFVVNVSHELRTPLTAIKGFAETIAENADDENKRYADIINRHTDRLIYIVHDLLVLSEIEEKKIELAAEKINIKDILENAAKIFKQKIADKKLELKLRVEDDAVFLRGDAFKLEQLFINLIDNAVKYTDEGQIAVTVKREGGSILIEVRDTGIGIAPEHIPRLFERFYVVDKNRSRSMGGTGLGLSIVKHIAFLHNAAITVESKPGEGTAFIIIFPQVNPS